MTMADQQTDDTFDEQVSETLTLLLGGKTDQALSMIEGLQKRRPDAPEVLYLMGMTAARIDEVGRALMFLEEAHRSDPECFEYAEALANLHARVGNLNDGLYFAKLSTTLEPHPRINGLLPADLSNFFVSLEQASPPRQYYVGALRLKRREFEEAARELDRFLQLSPDDVPCHRDASMAKLQLGKFEHAIAHVQKAVSLAPEDETVHFQAGYVSQAIGAFDAALFHFNKVFDLTDDQPDLLAATFARACTIPGVDEAVRDEMKSKLDRVLENAPGRPVECTPSDIRKERIHIAYVTNDGASADTAALLEPLLRLHDRSRFRVELYQQTLGSSGYMKRMATSADTVRKIWELDDETASVIVSGDQIDVMVNVCSADDDYKASLFAMKPSHIQVGFVGANHGIQMPGITHVLCDPSTEDAIRAHVGADQMLAQVPPGLWAVSTPQMLPDVGPLPAASNGDLTLGAVCDLAALTPTAVETFRTVLEALPGSRLVFGASAYVDSYPRRRIAELFAATPVADRVAVWDGPEMDDKRMVNHAFWGDVDLLLVPEALNAPLRAAESLWMGVPVLTVSGGDTPAACAATSILASAAQMQWTRTTAADLVELVKEIAGDLDGLAETRASLREAVRNSALFRPEAHVQALEALYTSMVDMRDKALSADAE